MLQTNETLSTKKSLQVLASHTPLELEGAWRLDSEEARRLTDAAGSSPAGGWRGLAALAAGCGVLKASRDEFEAGTQFEEIADWTDQQTTRNLLEAYTKRLVPPTTAAGLFIMLSIHPAWGVHLAHRVHRQNGDDIGKPNRTPAKPKLFPEESLELVGSMVSRTLHRIVDRLVDLDPSETHSIREFADFIHETTDDILDEAREHSTPDDGLAPLVDTDKLDSNWRVVDFAANDLLDSYLVPAGAARRTDATFRVDTDALAGIDVFTLD